MALKCCVAALLKGHMVPPNALRIILQFVIGFSLQTSLPPKPANPDQNKPKTYAKLTKPVKHNFFEGSDSAADSLLETDGKLSSCTFSYV